MLMSPGFGLVGATLPTPDIADPHTLLAGVAARFATRPPEPDPQLLEEFTRFVFQWLEKNLKPLAPDTDLSFKTWIDSTAYPQARKDELGLIWDARKPLEARDARVNMFMKFESYQDFKHGRAINSRSDRFKVEVGPMFAAIEKELFKLEWFIKKVPVADRARYIFDRLPKGQRYLASDYTSFEALFTRQIMDACEFQLYAYMVSALPGGEAFMETVRTYLGGTNWIYNRNLTLSVDATRMSGEMCTSLGNGFSNLMFILFLCSRMGSEVVGVVEGDDGLFAINGRVPTTEDFAELGLIVKLEEHAEVNTASFCGQVFDLETFTVITDPRKVLASFGWIDGKYLSARRTKQLAMLRAKAWSFGYQYPACPVVSALARAALRLTRSIDQRAALRNRSLDLWQLALLREAFDAGRPELNAAVSPASRELMHRVFGVSPEVQRWYENYFDNMTELSETPRILEVPASWLAYNSMYVRKSVYTDQSRPPEDWKSVHPCRLPPEVDDPAFRGHGVG